MHCYFFQVKNKPDSTVKENCTFTFECYKKGKNNVVATDQSEGSILCFPNNQLKLSDDKHPNSWYYCMVADQIVGLWRDPADALTHYQSSSGSTVCAKGVYHYTGSGKALLALSGYITDPGMIAKNCLQQRNMICVFYSNTLYLNPYICFIATHLVHNCRIKMSTTHLFPSTTTTTHNSTTLAKA